MAPAGGGPHSAPLPAMATAAVFLLLISTAFCGHAKCTEGVTLVAPAAAVPGRPTAVLVTLRGAAPVNVTLRLVSDRVEEATQLLASAHQTVRGQGIVSLSVPADASGACILQALVNCSGGGGGTAAAAATEAAAGGEDECSLQASTQLTVLGTVREVLVRPARHSYRPRETVFFWVLALDHSLRGARDVTGSVSVRDPSGVRIALWEEVALDMGVKEFSVELAAEAAAGEWVVEVRAEAAVFEATFNVTTEGSASAGGAGTSAAVAADDVPEVAMAEEHFVELRFGPDMRRLYKPGLPFVGRVEAVSSEQCVRVRVKVYDNTTAIYSQDVEITSGEGMFVVPAILADSEVITLQAELVSVEGKEIDSHYVLAREPVHKWRSASDCYLLVEGLEHTLQPEETARAAVLSTCPCTRPLHFLVTTGGRAIQWGALPPPPATATKSPPPPRDSIDGAAVCRMNFSFPVEDIMAPVSHLLVYYVTEDGEPISDVISFDVKLLLKDVSVSGEARKYWLPGQSLSLNVSAEEGALVCLIGGGGPGSGSGSNSGDSRPPATSVDTRRRRRPAAAAEADFVAAGVSLFQRRCDKRREARPPALTPGASPYGARRSLLGAAALDRLWLWHCFNYTASRPSAAVAAPEEPGKWALWALTLSPRAGLRVSPALAVAVFRPLSVFFSLPAALRVGETLEVDVRIGNNINSCMDVTALLALTEGAHFLSNGLLYVTEKLRLGPHGATSLVVRVVVTSPGDKNMTVEVSGYASESCRDPTVVATNSTLVGSVLRSAVVSVRPEGLVRTATESAYFCANENMVISTSEDFRYEFVSAPRNRADLVFEVRAAASAHVALSDVRYTSERMYQLVLGDLDNSVSWIGRGKHGFGVHLATAATPQLLSEGAFRTFWVSWGGGAVSLGRGPVPGENRLLKWRIDRKLRVQHIGFASAWGRAAEFRVWNYNDEAGFSQVLHLDVPQPVVPGTEAGTLLIAGGLSLPTSAAPPSPRARSTSLAACVAAFSPLPLLQGGEGLANGSWAAPREQVLRRLQTQVQALLAFRLPDGSFSDIRSQGSHMGTLQALRALARLQAYAGVDPELLASAKRWLQRRQAADGRFPAAAADAGVPEPGAGDELDRDVARTAETLAALLELGLESEADSECALRARYFLERHVFRAHAPTAVALQAHALAQARSEMAPAALDLLRNASANEEGDFGWPRAASAGAEGSAGGAALGGALAGGGARDGPDWLYEEGANRRRKEPALASVEEFKASLFTLMTYVRIGDLKSAEPVARYLFYRAHLLDKHIELLYPAVQAFAEFASLALDRHRALTVSLATSGMELTDTLELRPGAAPQHLQLPSLPTKVFVYATGAGCATVQGRVSYSTYAPAGHTQLLDLWAGVEGELVPSRNSLDELEGKLPRLRLRSCIRWKGEEPSSILRLEITLFSGFQLESVNPTDINIHHGSLGDLVWFVLTNVSNTCPFCVHFLVRSPFVVSGLRPAFARVYPVGREDLAAETFFHTSRGSPLLADITDDDLITWFGKGEAGQPRMGSDFSDVCECGKVCPLIAPTTTTVVHHTEISKNEENNLDKANILILSEANVTGNVTQFTLTSAELTLQNNIENNSSSEPSLPEIAFVGNLSNSEPVLVISNAKSVATESASFDIIIPAEDAEALGAAPDQLVIIATNVSELKPNNTSKNVTESSKLDVDANSTNIPSITLPTTIPPPVTTSDAPTTHVTIENTSGTSSSSPEIKTTTTETSSSSQTIPHPQQPRSINKERHWPGPGSTPPTLEPASGTVQSTTRDEKLFVLDRDALWGMLKEVVHVELNKRNRRGDSSVDAVLH